MEMTQSNYREVKKVKKILILLAQNKFTPTHRTADKHH
jgi:hypothetical protein